MAAGFIIKKKNIRLLDDYVQNHYLKQNINFNKVSNYDFQVSLSAVNNNFVKEIEKLGPFGHCNTEPILLIKNIKVLKSKIINERHIMSFIKPRIGKSIKSISFNSINTKLEKYLLAYNNEMKIIAKIKKNMFNNKTNLQLLILDIII